MKRLLPNRLLVLVLLLIPVIHADAQDSKRRPMQIDDLFRFKRVVEPRVSPDGKRVAYAVGDVDLDNNKTVYHLWIASTDEKGGQPRQLTNAPKSDRNPRWSPDGKNILFESTRSGDSQLWMIPVGGGEARRLTSISTGANNAIWSPDGSHISFVSAVFPENSEKPFKESDKLNKKRMDEIAQNPVKAKTFTKLFFRHWDEYVEDKRQHLFVMPVNDGQGGEPRDVTPGDRDAYPTSTTFSSGEDFSFSPDGKYLVFTAVPAKNEAWSTNYDICRVPITGGSAEWECLTKDNPAADGGPQFSPDGKVLVYRAQKKAGFEADRWQLMAVDVDAGGAFKGAPRSLTPDWDRSPDSFVWGPSANIIYCHADDQGGVPIFEIDIQNGKVDKFISGQMNGSLSVSKDGNVLAFTKTAMDHPVEIRLAGYKKLNAIGAFHNQALLDELDRPRPESVTVKGANGDPMQMWILKPPGFDPNKKWPLAFLVHGGPQGAWEDGWSFRWNPQAWAAQGYVVALPNPRGSTGFGQKYVDEISGDWGGKCYTDLMAGLAYLEKQPYIDTARMAAAGASFGGYMMNWFAVNTDKFKTLITHCGVWNFDSMYATTEEIWFDEWEHGGPPWGKNRESYEKHSPHRLAGNLSKFKTPMLVIHNDLDFRVPVSEGLQLFTTLQRQGVPSRFVNFPDEGHWVLKPRNSQHWHNEVFAWLKKHVPAGGR
ncbi:MAG: S9 family peptidase [Planctomycetes bacterium]|nr:S9 family peptidase [Planctomycetota bacterium]